MSNITSHLGKVLLMLGMLAVVPMAANAEGTDLEEGARGTIVEPTGRSDSTVIYRGHMRGPVNIAQPGEEGTDLQRDSRGNIDRPAGWVQEKEVCGERRRAVPQQDRNMEGVDLERGAKTSINN